ncbi:MAG: hypothetical protein Kow0068_13290 [Marinilabiliales bacterium]
MKKLMQQLLLVFFGMIPIILFSQKNIPEGLTITQNGYNYIINFALPSYSFDTISVTKPDGTSEDFIDFITNEDFGIIDTIGLPQLPQLTFMFAIPYESNVPDIIIQNVQEQEIYVSNRIYPFQKPVSTDPDSIIPQFTIDENYYNATGIYYDPVAITDEFIVAGVKGIRITICPFTYNPSQNKITVRTNIVFEIPMVGQITTKCAESSILDSFFKSLFINEVPLQKSVTKGNYLIITAPDYQSTITYFANYKRNIGYNVTVVSTNTTGTSNDNIKDYIQTRYDNTSTRPVFVLLVGDTDKIPCWIGKHRTHPKTDLYYATLEGGNNDRVPDVFLGRFSTRTTADLQNIINKTIYMETNIHNLSKKAVFLADDFWKTYKEGAHNTVIDDAFEPNNYTCLKLYADDGATSNDAINALNDNQIFMLYAGHGNSSRISDPKVEDDDIQNLTNIVYPFGFSFACSTNKFEKDECFGEAWIRKNHGGVAYYGATHATFVKLDNVLEKKIFKHAWYNNNKEQLSPMIKLGMEKFCNNLYTITRRKKYREMYNLMGDPSLITIGIGCLTDYIFANAEVFHAGDIITYHAANNITNNADFFIESGADVTLKAGNSIVLKPGFHAEAGSHFHASIEPCNSSKSMKSLNSNENVNTENEDNKRTVLENVYENKVNAYPNPFSRQTTLEYTLQETSDVNIEVYNLLGEKMLIENINNKEQGTHTYNISGVNFQNGIYIIKVQTKEYKEVLFIYKINH